MENLILVYQDPNKLYTLFIDASKWTWWKVWIREQTTSIDGKVVGNQHPVTYVGDLFQGS